MCGYYSHPGIAHVPGLFFTLAVGYGVLFLAQRADRPLDVLGRLVGAIVMIGSFAGLLCIAAAGLCAWRQCHKGGSECGPMMSRHCPDQGHMGQGEESPAPKEGAPESK